MKITAFETQKVSFDEFSHYGWLFLEACILFALNLGYLDCHNSSLVCSRTFGILAPLKKNKTNLSNNFLCDLN